MQLCSLVITLILVRIVWLGEGGTLWRAKWTRRGQKEPHPSITRVDKGGLNNKKKSWMRPRKLFFRDARRRDRSPTPSGEWSFPPAHLWLFSFSTFLSRLKLLPQFWCVSAQTWAQSRREQGERHREWVSARGESERSGPLFLCLMRGALRGELEGMLWHASRQRSEKLHHKTLGITYQWASEEVR